MIYVASPKYPQGAANRQEDCRQCVSSSLAADVERGNLNNREDEVLASAIAAGWEPDEVREALDQIRPRPNARAPSEPALAPDPGIVPSSSV
jgi:hypothetical protein